MTPRKIYPTFPEGKFKVFTMSYDDGNDADMRLVEMMRRHHIVGTFNINTGCCPDTPAAPKPPHTWTRMTMKQCLETYGDDMEIAIHGVVHPFWDKITSAQAMADILDDRRDLEKATGRIIRGAAFPYGRYTDDVLEILRLAGIEYCREVATTKNLRLRDQNFLCLKGTVRQRDPELQALTEKFIVPEKPTAQLKMFYVWGHSFEFEEDHNWDMMENFLSTVSDREDVWYATNIQMIDYLNAAKSLKFSVDSCRVYNPTAAAVWLMVFPSHTLVKVPGGATVELPTE